MNHQELKMRETRGTFLEFSGVEINKREVSVPKIIFRVPMMRQNQRECLATDVNMNYVCVADTHQHHRLLFPSHYTLNDKTHTYAHLHCQLTGELGLLRGWVFWFPESHLFHYFQEAEDQHFQKPFSKPSVLCSH